MIADTRRNLRFRKSLSKTDEKNPNRQFYKTFRGLSLIKLILLRLTKKQIYHE